MSEDLEVLFEDNHLLAVNKPSGVLTQPSDTVEDSVETRAKEWVRRVKEKPGAVFLHAVHRLDREVSGVVLFARTSKALSRLNEEMRSRRVEKIYHALLEGVPPEENGVLEHWLVHGSHAAKVVPAGSTGARLARLEYRALRHDEGLTLVEVRLETGRYHQIRAQLAAMGCPVAGDGRYGSRRATSGRIALHHRRLTLEHPVRKETVGIEAPYPAEWPSAWTPVPSPRRARRAGARPEEATDSGTSGSPSPRPPRRRPRTRPASAGTPSSSSKPRRHVPGRRRAR
ncbi:MAG: RNA pseudouridine synthase [bacterium]